MNGIITPESQQAKTGLALPELAKIANEAHRECEAAANSAVQHALTAGRALEEAKSSVAHGNWGDWLKANCSIPERTAQFYMRVSRNWPAIESKAQRVADLSLRDVAKLVTVPTDKSSLADRAWQRFEEQSAALADELPQNKAVLDELKTELDWLLSENCDLSQVEQVKRLRIIADESLRVQQTLSERMIRSEYAIGKWLNTLERKEAEVQFGGTPRFKVPLPSEGHRAVGISGERYLVTIRRSATHPGFYFCEVWDPMQCPGHWPEVEYTRKPVCGDFVGEALNKMVDGGFDSIVGWKEEPDEAIDGTYHPMCGQLVGERR